MSICDLDIQWTLIINSKLMRYQFCQPYPSCIEDYVGEQDTSDCD